MIRNKTFLYSFLICMFLAAACNQNAEHIKFSGETMGTYYAITIGKADVKIQTIKASVDSVLKEVNTQMSTYLSKSVLSQFNKYRDTVWFKAPKELISVVEESKNIYEQSDGCFDITVGPLVNLWGFGPENRPETVPSDNEIIARKILIGSDKLLVDKSFLMIKKKIPELYCDLSAIAKGYGVDAVAKFLEQKGIKDYLVEIGGEVRTRGKNQFGEEWKVGISSVDGGTGIQRVIHLSGNSIATSGDYRNYFEENGIRYSHTIDPRTGKPINHKLVSVSVICKECMSADGYATAIMVLGPEEGLAFAEKLNLPVFIIVKKKDGFKEIMTESFKKYLK
ncbi:MAG: FAD:protein FMN transferase [Ignavibacteria bacterium]|nr:FAD:protein FMN transferase [Ignavibacteria bacterium]